MKNKHKTFDQSFLRPDSRPKIDVVGISNKTAYIVVSYRGKELVGRVAKSLAKQLLKDS